MSSRGLYAYNGLTATVNAFSGSARIGVVTFTASDYQTATGGKTTTGQSIGTKKEARRRA